MHISIRCYANMLELQQDVIVERAAVKPQMMEKRCGERYSVLITPHRRILSAAGCLCHMSLSLKFPLQFVAFCFHHHQLFTLSLKHFFSVFCVFGEWECAISLSLKWKANSKQHARSVLFSTKVRTEILQ